MARGGRPLKVHPDLERLHIIVEYCEYNNLTKLVEQHGINAYDGYKQTALIYACLLNKVDILNWLIEKSADINFQDRNGFTGLHFASQFKHEMAVEILIEKGANVNLLNKYGNPPVWGAIFEEDFSIVKRLIQAGANIDIKNNYNRSPREIGINIYGTEFVEFIDREFIKDKNPEL